MPLARTCHPAPAVFLDRDGTLIEDRGHLGSPDQVIFIPESVAALKRLQPHFKLIVVTNQSGVSTGELTMAQVQAVNTHIVERLQRDSVVIAAVYCCPHQRAEGCRCIKPNRFFADMAAREHGLDLARSFAVGDHPHDAEFGRQLGGTGLYVLTGHGLKHRGELRGDEIVIGNISEAADWILSNVTDTAPQRASQAPPSAGNPRDAHPAGPATGQHRTVSPPFRLPATCLKRGTSSFAAKSALANPDATPCSAPASR